MLNNIQFSFPHHSSQEIEFFAALKKIFGKIPHAMVNEKNIVVRAFSPSGALPEIHIDGAAHAVPAVHFNFTTKKEDTLSTRFQTYFSSHKLQKKTNRPLPALSTVAEKIAPFILRIDHVGVNIPAINISKEIWNQLLLDLAGTTTLYRYPTGEDWPFILPATQAELESDIHIFCQGREPKFELVYDRYTDSLVFQFDLELQLSKKEVETIFPDPIGISFEGLEHVFRSIYVHSPWDGYKMRFDLRFQSDTDLDWKTGKWLVEEGGRI